MSTNVAIFQCCGSGRFIPDPEFYPSRISDPGSRISNPGSWKPDLGSNNNNKGVGKNLFYLFCSHKLTKLLTGTEINLRQLIKIYSTFYPKIVTKFSENTMGLSFRIRKISIPDPGVKKAPDPGSATLLGSILTYGCRTGLKKN